MPKTVNRPRDDIEAQQLQQGPIDLGDEMSAGQADEAETRDDRSEPRSPA